MKVLLVDDEPAILETLEHRLRKEGYTVFTAPTAEDGMRIYRQTRPDLMVLDVMLPNRSGFDLCKAIRRDSKVPIIFLTAQAAVDDRVAGLEAGGRDYVTKPFHAAELLARVRAVLKEKTAQDEAENLAHAGAERHADA